MKRVILLLLLVTAFITAAMPTAFAMEAGMNEFETEMEFANYTERGTVLQASEIEERPEDYFSVQNVTLRIDSGKFKGDIHEIENVLSDHAYYDIIVEEGQRVSLMIEEYPDGGYNVYISDYYRINSIIYLLGAFVVLVVLIGGSKGVKSLISLGVTISAVLFVMLPLILKGINPILVSVITAVLVTIVTIVLVAGFNHKSLSAIAGTSIGVIVAGVISYIVGNQASLSGLSAEEATMLMYIPQGIQFNFRHLLFAGIIMGALGAAMDVGISIASAIDEIHKANPRLSARRLFRSGMNVGKDVMGTMVNTLILAYTGTSIPMLLLFMAYETDLSKVFNLDVIATEIVRSLSGSIGLILTIPITAMIASYYAKDKRVAGDKDQEENEVI
ncbi:MAG TPA: YibE/F family protein [Tissierellaceae bacterium]|nr:YibE/F family protein [Tissierellaceae bacterium]